MPCLAQLVERLFGGLDLFLGLVADLDHGCAGGDVLAQLHQFAAQGEFADHLGVIARGIGADRGTGHARQIGRAAQFLQALVVFQKGLDGDGAGQGVLADAFAADVIDAGMDRVIEMVALDDLADPVEHVVIGQQRAQQLLFRLERIGDRCLFALVAVLTRGDDA